MDLELSGRVALVTGAGTGIGRGICEILAAEGIQLVAVARRAHLLHEMADEVHARGASRPLVIVADLTRGHVENDVRNEVVTAFGRLDILVNNAGASMPLGSDSGDDHWNAAFALNFTAVRRLTHAFLASMRERGWGRVINITGTSEPLGLNAANAAKAAVHAWAKGLSREEARYSITVNSIAPGRIESEQILQRYSAEDRKQFAGTNIPLGRFGDPKDVGHLVAFLASPRASYITGEIIHVDGGLRRFAF